MDIDTTGLAAEKYVSLTTFRRNGDAVPTPVWVAKDGEALVVITDASSGKVKRLKHTDAVRLAACDMRGRVRGPSVPGTAQLLDQEGTNKVWALIQQKYGLTARLLGVKEIADEVVAKVLRRDRTTSRVGIRITVIE